MRSILAHALSCAAMMACAAPRPRVLCEPHTRFELRQAAPGIAALTRVAVTGAPFRAAWRVAVTRRPAHPWHVELRASIPAPVAKNDALLLRFYARGVELQAAAYVVALAPFLQESRAPFKKLNRAITYTAGSAWNKIEIPIHAPREYRAGELMIVFHTGQDVQTLDIGGIELLNYGDTAPLDALPRTGLTYDGRAPDAPWRTAAWERIRRIRTAPVAVTLLDQRGAPITNARVRLAMQRHAFRFGCAIGSRWFTGPLAETAEAARYRAVFTNWFNAAVFAGEMKWPAWQKPAVRDRVTAALAWFATHGISARGHCLVWPKWKWLPERLLSLSSTPERLQQAVLTHITGQVSALRGRISDYDVVNEPYTCHDLIDILGPRAVAEWFRAAHQADPSAARYINDFGILSRRDDTGRHRDHYEQTIRTLLQHGAPLDGIGMQGHVYFPLCGPEELLATLSRFARLRGAIQITEHDVMIDDEHLQADYARDFLTVVFSHPAVRGIYIWGFWDGDHWKRNALLYRRDWSLKPSGKAWRDLLFHQWWTRTNLVTDARGTCATRGFMGTYQLTIRTAGRAHSLRFDLPPAGTNITVTLPLPTGLAPVGAKIVKVATAVPSHVCPRLCRGGSGLPTGHSLSFTHGACLRAARTGRQGRGGLSSLQLVNSKL